MSRNSVTHRQLRDDLQIRIDYVARPTLDRSTVSDLILIKSIFAICFKLVAQGDMVSLQRLFQLHRWMQRPLAKALFRHRRFNRPIRILTHCSQPRSDYAMYKFLESVVSDYMTCPVKTVTRSLTMRKLGELFGLDDFNTYPVEENELVLGLVSKFDFLNCFAFRPGHMLPRYDDLMSRTVADIMTPEYIYVSATTKMARVLQLMVDHRIKSIPVIEANSKLTGIISREDVMRALVCSITDPDHAAPQIA